MIRFFVWAALSVSLVLTGCTEAEAPRGAVDRLTPQLAEAHYNYRFNNCSGAMSESERAKLYRFLRELHLTEDDVLVVTLPKGRNPTRDVQRMQTMMTLLRHVPAQKRYLAARDFRDNCRSQSTGMIRVVRTLSVQADCEGSSAGRPDGCSSGHNLAVMMASPSDSFLPPQTTNAWTTARQKRNE